MVPGLLSIGEFARVCHLSAKALRNYHRLGLLEPVRVDEHSGYRHYSLDQVESALLIGRLRSVDMPLARIADILGASDQVRRLLINAYADDLLQRAADLTTSAMELRTSGVASDLVTIRAVERAPALVAAGRADLAHAPDVVASLVAEVEARAEKQGVATGGPVQASFAAGVFVETGEVTVHLPVSESEAHLAEAYTVAGEFAALTHYGDPARIAGTYATIGRDLARREVTWEAQHAVVERYVRAEGPLENWEIEVLWPIFDGEAAD